MTGAHAPLEVGIPPIDGRAHERVAQSFGLTGDRRFTFEGQPVRAVLIEGEPWFVAADVCVVLGLGNVSQALTGLDDDERNSITIADGTPGNPTRAIINEPGLYSLVVRSRMPQARAFRRWVTHEVLPSIRRTGSYAAPALPQSYADALRELAASVEARAALEVANAELTPRAEAWDDLADAAGDYAVADAASILKRAGVDTGPQRLFETLGEIRWTYRGEGRRWRPYATALDAGYLTERAMPPRRNSDDELVPVAPQVRITARGLERLRVRLGVLTEVAS